MSPDVSTDLLQALLAQAPDALIYADRSGTIRLWNDAAERIFGHPAEDAVGKTLDTIVPERFRAAHWTGYQRALEAGQTQYAGRVLTTRSIHRDNGRIYVDLSFGLVRDRGGQVIGVLAIARDCTKRHADTGAPA